MSVHLKNPLWRILCFRRPSLYDIVIIGAGPAGLSCAIAAQEAGLRSLVIDKGSVVDAIRRFPAQMTFFSTPDLLSIGGVPFVTPSFRPSRTDAVRYYQAVAATRLLDIRTWDAATAIEGSEGSFTVRTAGGALHAARTVVIATGYFDTPLPYPVPGADLPSVRRMYDEPFAYAGRSVVLVGGKNSVVDAALELFRADAKVTIVHRGNDFSAGVKYWLLPDIRNRIAAGEVKAFFGTEVERFTASTVRLRGATNAEIPYDTAFVLIGYTIDQGLAAAAGVRFDPGSDAPLHDAQTFETDVPGLFVVGSFVSGRKNNAVFIENGRHHGVKVVAAIRERARRWS